ncbi:Sugar kinases, ribokinase family [uncultured Candidatus Thioglobus sp.]|nr:Sugar kinases, ribokinase family [uncultured Candidatus Thioglobus sp.]
MSAIIFGSFAYDNIMSFPDAFKKHILPDRIDQLNVCFMTPTMRREFGGCAGNISFNLKLLGSYPIPIGSVGKDFMPYDNWLEKHEISRQFLHVQQDIFTAQAFIITDIDENQITVFHPGAMNFSHVNNADNPLKKSTEINIGIISPDGRDGMLQHATQLVTANIPFIFDPGQGLPMFSSEELKNFIAQANWIALNQYEWQLLSQCTSMSIQEVTQQLQALIITQGENGSVIHTSEQTYEIPIAKPKCVIDPTGCGDAYRAGLLYGIMYDIDWQQTGQIAALMGAINLEQHGTQNHTFTMDEFRTRYKENFSMTMPRSMSSK